MDTENHGGTESGTSSNRWIFKGKVQGCKSFGTKTTGSTKKTTKKIKSNKTILTTKEEKKNEISRFSGKSQGKLYQSGKLNFTLMF